MLQQRRLWGWMQSQRLMRTARERGGLGLARLTEAREMIRLQPDLRVQARDSAAIRRRLEWRESVTWASKRNGRWTGCGIVEHFCVDSDRTGSTATVQLMPDLAPVSIGHGRPACRLLPRDSDSPVHEAVTLTPALDCLRAASTPGRRRFKVPQPSIRRLDHRVRVATA